MKAMIFAAGLGTRLRPITDTMPKALVPIAGKPLLQHAIEKLAASGYDDIVVNVHHFPDMIIDWLSGHPVPGVRCSVSDERDRLLETGGAILHAESLLTDCGPCGAPDRPFLVHNVDIVSNLDLEWMRGQWRPDAMALLAVSGRNTQRYLLFDDDLRLAGWTNLATGQVRSPYGDIDPGKYRKLAFSGIQMLSPAVFGTMRDCGLGERFPIMDFYLKECTEHPVYAALPDSLTVVDVGKIDSLPEAEAAASNLLGSDGLHLVDIAPGVPEGNA